MTISINYIEKKVNEQKKKEKIIRKKNSFFVFLSFFLFFFQNFPFILSNKIISFLTLQRINCLNKMLLKNTFLFSPLLVQHLDFHLPFFSSSLFFQHIQQKNKKAFYTDFFWKKKNTHTKTVLCSTITTVLLLKLFSLLSTFKFKFI